MQLAKHAMLRCSIPYQPAPPRRVPVPAGIIRILGLVADIDADGLSLAREPYAIRSDLRIVYTATAPHRVAEGAKVSGAPILR